MSERELNGIIISIRNQSCLMCTLNWMLPVVCCLLDYTAVQRMGLFMTLHRPRCVGEIIQPPLLNRHISASILEYELSIMQIFTLAQLGVKEICKLFFFILCILFSNKLNAPFQIKQQWYRQTVGQPRRYVIQHLFLSRQSDILAVVVVSGPARW